MTIVNAYLQVKDLTKWLEGMRQVEIGTVPMYGMLCVMDPDTKKKYQIVKVIDPEEPSEG